MLAETTIIGRLGGDPESRYTPSGKLVVSFSVATDKVWYDAAGVKQEKTTWYRISVWEKRAESCAKYLHKGSMVMVRGSDLEGRAFIDRDGNPRASLDMTGDMVKFLSSKGDTGQDAGGRGGTDYTSESSSTTDEDSIPF